MISVEICAGCLDTSGQMFQINKGEIQKLYSVLSGLKTASVNNMPGYLCHICFTYLKRFYKFRKRCQEAHKFVKIILGKDKKLTIEAVNSIDKKLSGLEIPLSYMDIKKANVIFIEDLPIVPEVRGPYTVLKVMPTQKIGSNQSFSISPKIVDVTSVKSDEKDILEDSYENMSVIADEKEIYNEEKNYTSHDEHDISEFEQKMLKLGGNETSDYEEKLYMTDYEDVNKTSASEYNGISDDDDIKCELTEDEQYEISENDANSDDNENVKNDVLLTGNNNLEEYELLIVGNDDNIQFDNSDSLKHEDPEYDEELDEDTLNNDNDFEETVNDEETNMSNENCVDEEYEPNQNPALINSKQRESQFKLSKYFYIYKMPIQEQIEQIMKRKLTNDYINARYKCEFCFRSTQNTFAFENHMKVHNKALSGPYRCKVCKKCLPKKSLLHNHLQRSHAFKFKCKECNIMFYNISGASRHCRIAHRELIRSCEYCNKTFKSEYTHEVHLRTYHARESCYVCGESFVNKRGVAIHMHHVHGQKVALFTKKNRTIVDPKDPNYCLKCDMKFKNITAFQRHITIDHPKDSARRRWKAKLSPTEQEQTDHKDPNYCLKCDRKFLSSAAYERHVLTNSRHTDRRHIAVPSTPLRREKLGRKKGVSRKRQTYVCSVCDEPLLGYQAFEKHYAAAHPADTLPMMFVCEICGKGFRKSNILDSHMRSHVQKAFACALCDTKFTLEVNMKRHMQIHTGEKPFQCDYCPYRCRQKHAMKLHIQTVHLKIPYAPWHEYRKRKREKRLMKAREEAEQIALTVDFTEN